MTVNRTAIWLETLWRELYPPLCALCGAPGTREHDLCAPCRRDLPVLGTACFRCAQPLPIAGICGACQQHAPPQNCTFSPFRYAPPLDYLLLQLKFHGKLHLAPLLGQLTAEYLEQRIHPLPECIIPVPLHPTRLRERGFNQALELAQPVADQLQIPIHREAVYRQRNTARQSELPRQERKRNLRGAFALQGSLTARHVAIMDDVLTTGHTVAELARTLRRGGAQVVEVWTCARVPAF